jgi:H+-transporting ATPase
MPVLMLMLITLLNDGALISIGYDNAIPSKQPEKWNLTSLFFIGSVLALVALTSSLILLYLLLDSWNEVGLFQKWGLGGLSYGQVTSAIYLKVSVSDFLTLFSSRTGDKWFFQSRPAPILIIAAGLALTISTILACAWPRSRPDGIPTEGLALREPYALALYIWLYCIVWWWVQDACKVFAYYLMAKYNWFGVNEGYLTSDDMLAQIQADAIKRDADQKSEEDDGAVATTTASNTHASSAI